VTNINDSGVGSLRQAILDANANPGADSITFAIGSGLQTIAPTATLPDISDPVVIDGTTQPGFAGSPLIELSAVSIPSFPNRGVLFLTGGNTTIRGLIINRFRDGGISIVTAGGNRIEGNYIGTDPTGNVSTGSTGNGISINNSPSNVIGGTGPNTRNVISGIGSSHGISIFGFNPNGNLIQGNYIGLNASGTKGLGNFSGIFLGTSNNTVGGIVSEARNVISANDFAGIVMQVEGTSGNLIQGNYIGTDASGNVKIGNTNYGIAIFNASHNNTIGGMIPGARNVVSGNGWGIGIAGSSGGTPSGNVVQGNYVGVAADGSTPMGNRVEGIRLAPAFNTTVGGVTPGAGNIVAFNGPTAEIGVGTGIEVLAGDNNSIRGNSIFSNGRLGIDLGNDGVTPNDSGDSDTGNNTRQNFPLITSVVSDSSQTTITGTLNSTPNTAFNIDFYSNAACDSSGNGEGAKPFGLSFTTVTTDANGNGSFGVAFSTLLPVGRVITATATNPAGNTSEFSPCDASKAMGSAQFSSTSYKVIEDVGFVTITVNRVGGNAGSLTVDYSTADISATAGEDYSGTSGTLTFADGETSKTFDVPILDDAVDEPDELLELRLRNVTNPDALGNPNSAELTLQDKSNPPSLSVNDFSVIEGNSGTTTAIVTVSLFPATGRTVTVNYSTVAFNATSGVDFQPVSGSLTFNPRVTTQTIIVSVIGDTLDEIDERFFVRLTNPFNAFVATSGIATIVDEDLPPTMSISDVSVNENNSGTTTAFFTINLSAPSGKVVSVRYTTVDGSASSASDYVAVAQTVITLNPGETNKTLGITVNGDSVVEPDENFFVNLTLAENANIVDSQAIGAILNDDGTTVPLQLIFDESGPSPVQTAALDSILHLRDPFQVVYSANRINLGADPNTRIVVFVRNLQLTPGEPSSSVVVNLVDSSQLSYDLTAEDVRSILGVDLIQVIFRLPDNLAPGMCSIKVRAHGQSSNSGTIRIRI
jgi:hypothetical protein